MKTEDEINEIVTAEGGVKMKVGKFPTYLNKIKREGFRIELGKIRSFWIKDEQMVFGESPSQAWQKVLDKIQGQNKTSILTDTEIPEEVPQQNESTEIADRFVPAQTGSVLIPSELTMPLLEKWKKMSTFERMLLFQTTPESIIYKREGPAGKTLKYVKGNKMLQELNIAFLFDWSSTIEEVKETETGYWVRGYISANLDGKTITRSSIGTADKHKGVTSEDVAKAAAMDMIKKAASSFGFNGDIYRGEV